MAAADYYTQVYTMFVGYFGRPPAQSGLDYYANQVNAAGGKLDVVINDFYNSAESQSFFAGKTIEQQVNQIFQNLFGRDAAPSGLNYWTNLIATGKVALAQAAYTIAYNAQAADSAILKAKVDSAKLWVAGLDTTTEILTYSTDAGRTAGRDFLKTITTSTAAAQTAVDSALTSMVNSGNTNPGKTFTFTTAIDNLTGTSGNDTFIGDNSGTTATVTGGDQVNGGDGIDTLKFYTKAGTAVTIPAMSKIEALFVSGNDTSDINVAGYADITSLTIDKAGQLKGYTLGAGDSFALTNDNQNSGGPWGANVVLSSADTSTNVTFDTVGKSGGNSAVDLKGTSLATVNITALNKNYVALNNTAGATGVKTVTIAGSGSLVLDTDTNGLTGLTTINASGNSGGVTLDVAASKLTFTGGTGNDEVQFDATELTADDKLVGGTGTDTIKIVDTAVTSAASDVVKGINASSGFEYLALGAAGSSVDFDVITASGIKSVRIDAGAGTYALSNATNDTTVEISAGVTIGANNFDIANKLGQTTTNLKVDATAAGASSVTQLKLTGINTINIESDFAGAGSQGTANTVTLTAQSDNTVFNVKGDHALALTLLAGATTTGSTVNANAMTAALTLVATDKADSIVGGSGKDTITAGAGVDSVTGGAGADKFVVSTADIDTTAGAVTDVITDFVSGTDTVNLTVMGAGSGTSYVEAGAAAASLSALLSAADTALNGTVTIYVGQVGSDSYVVTDADGNGYTDVIKLTGVGLDQVAQADFV